jgi:AhpD family alkylhydroperoxidase
MIGGPATGVGGAGTGGAGKAGAGAPTDAHEVRDALRDQYGEVPEFIEKVPDAALPGVMEELQSLELSDATAIPPKYKSLISLAVAAQVPCEYCVFADRISAKKAGASEEELNEAVAMSASVRHWSTYMVGAQVDEKQFKSDVQHMLKREAKAGRR